MKRVAVVGPPGSGKSTFARKLAAKTGLPVVHMDYYHLDSNHDYPHDHEAWIKRALEFIEPERWIIEGNYGSTFTERFNRADTIIYLDYPRRVALISILKRRIQYRRKHRPEMPEDWREKFDWGFLKYAWRFSGTSTTLIKTTLRLQPQQKIVILKSRKAAQDYLNVIINA